MIRNYIFLFRVQQKILFSFVVLHDWLFFLHIVALFSQCDFFLYKVVLSRRGGLFTTQWLSLHGLAPSP